MQWLPSMPVMPPNWSISQIDEKRERKKNLSANEDGKIQRGASSDRLELTYGGGGGREREERVGDLS